MQQGIKKLQWFEYLKVVFLEILNLLVFANQVTYHVQQYHTRMVYKILLYAYGIKYAYGTEHIQS